MAGKTVLVVRDEGYHILSLIVPNDKLELLKRDVQEIHDHYYSDDYQNSDDAYSFGGYSEYIEYKLGSGEYEGVELISHYELELK